MAVLTLNERVDQVIFGDVVNTKGVTALVVEQVARHLDSMGHKRVVFRTGEENPITVVFFCAPSSTCGKVTWSSRSRPSGKAMRTDAPRPPLRSTRT